MGIAERVEMIWRNKFAPLRTLRETHLTCSQYSEDMIVQRLLLPSRTGTYVDVGAHHPVKGSNTYRLYAHGWSGLTIDPNPVFSSLFRRQRPRDIHLAEGVSNNEGQLTYFMFSTDVFNTFSSPRADALRKEGKQLIGTRSVRCRPLVQMVDENLVGRHIDLLSIDCEGLDLEALQSLKLLERRPTVLIIEDFWSLKLLQGEGSGGELKRFLDEAGYTPIAQTGWSSILIANDWRDLFLRSAAFSEEKVQNGYLPGQA